VYQEVDDVPAFEPVTSQRDGRTTSRASDMGERQASALRSRAPGPEGGHVVHLLIHLAEFRFRVASAGEGDHGRMREVRVSQPAARLSAPITWSHADAGLPEARA